MTKTACKLRKTPGLRNHLSEIWRLRTLYLLLVPAIVVTAVFSYQPMYGVIVAFQKYEILKGIWGSQFIGLENFRAFLASSDFYSAAINTLVLNAMFLTCFPIPIVFAVLINEFSWMRVKKGVQSITYLPHFVSWVVVGGLLYRMLDQDTGVVNLILENLFGMEKIGFFREPQYFRWILVIAELWKELGWNSILFLAAITAINPELYEAAVVDGAGRMRRIWHITLPGILPTVVILLIMSISAFFSNQAFEQIMALRNPMTVPTSDTIGVLVYYRGVRMGNYGFAASVGLTESLLSLFLLFSVNRISKKMSGYSLF